MPLRFDISSQNWDNYFAIQVAGLGEKQKEELPRELMYKIFKKGYKQDPNGITKLSFLAKIFILVKALKKRMVIIVEDENGLDQEEYFKYMELQKTKQKLELFPAKELVTEATFVLAKKDVMDTFIYMNEVCASKPYNYVSKAKNPQINRTAKDQKERAYIARFLSFYESNRKRLTINTGVNFSEWMILIYLYEGEYMKSSTIHKDWYKYSFNSSATKLKLAFSSLQQKGYVEKIGGMSNAKLRISSIGKNKCDELMIKYAINC